jgi:hypothetical protein
VLTGASRHGQAGLPFTWKELFVHSGRLHPRGDRD